jgi:shikimate kinase
VIILIGLPGSGKSTVGRQLARKLSASFVDSDYVIEQRLGCSIREYFEREGETAFRDVEERVIADLMASAPANTSSQQTETPTLAHSSALQDIRPVSQDMRAVTAAEPMPNKSLGNEMPSNETTNSNVVPNQKLLQVLSTGGGAVLRESNRQALRAGGHVVYLRSSPEDLYKRLRHDQNRPLLQVEDPLQRLRDLYEVRDPLYRETANFQVDTGRPSVASLVNMIVMQLDLLGA